jgi:hypothetical protein
MYNRKVWADSWCRFPPGDALRLPRISEDKPRGREPFSLRGLLSWLSLPGNRTSRTRGLVEPDAIDLDDTEIVRIMSFHDIE